MDRNEVTADLRGLAGAELKQVEDLIVDADVDHPLGGLVLATAADLRELAAAGDATDVLHLLEDLADVARGAETAEELAQIAFVALRAIDRKKQLIIREARRRRYLPPLVRHLLAPQRGRRDRRPRRRAVNSTRCCRGSPRQADDPEPNQTAVAQGRP